MNTFYLILDILALLLLGFILAGVSLKIIRSKNRKKSILRTVAALLLLLLIWLVPQYIVSNNTHAPVFSTLEEKTTFYDKHEHYKFELGIIEEALAKDSLNYDLHFKYVDTYRKYVDRQRKRINYDISKFVNSDLNRDITSFYQNLKNSDDTVQHDIGLLFLSFHRNNMGYEVRYIQPDLDNIYNKQVPYYNYVRGLTYFRSYDWFLVDSAENHLLASIEQGEAVESSYHTLGRLYWSSDQEDKLQPLIEDQEIEHYLPVWMSRTYHFNNFDISGYWSDVFDAEISEINIYGASAAFLILVIWIILIVRLDIYEKEKWHHLLITFLLGIVTMQLLYPLHDILWNYFDYYRPSYPVSDLAYMVISIGMVEEFVKILPVLIMLKFSKGINEPFDYILYPAVSALAFAFVENMGYFNFGGLQNIDVRGVTCCIVHMAFSATVGYGLMLGTYRKKYNKYLLFGLFFFIAASLHGLYDFWLMDWWAVEYSWVTWLIFFLCVHLLAIYTNTTLNISNFYSEKVNFRNDRLKYWFIVSLISILMIGYVVNALVFGPEYATVYHQREFRMLFFFILFIAVTMTSMDILRGYVKSISFPLAFLLFKHNKKHDLGGNWIELEVSNKFSLKEDLIEDLSEFNQLALLQKQFIVENNPSGALVQLWKPLNTDEFIPHQILLIPEWQDKSLTDLKKTLVKVFLIPNNLDLDKPLLEESDFQFVGHLFSQYQPEGVEPEG